MNKKKLTYLVKEKAYELGFSFVGMSKSGFLEEEAPHLERYLKNNYNGKMQYLENHFDMRLNPNLLVPGAKSVVSLLYNYYTENQQADKNAPKISMYAYGKDYHFVVKYKLKELYKYIEGLVGEIDGRVFCDSAPVLDKAWAKKSGLGWVGKHGLLINKGQGSYFFISELILDVEFEYDAPDTDHCGTCVKCIEACPTGAIIQPYVINGSKCISYFTIELKEGIPQEMKGKFDNWAFGCDACQTACPWNRFSIQHNEPEFLPHQDLLKMTANDWEDLTKEQFQEVFRKSAVKRTKYEGLKRNLNFLGFTTTSE